MLAPATASHLITNAKTALRHSNTKVQPPRTKPSKPNRFSSAGRRQIKSDSSEEVGYIA